MRGLQGEKALVTGGGSGIGQAIAVRLGQEGVDVAISLVVGVTPTRLVPDERPPRGREAPGGGVCGQGLRPAGRSA